MISTTKVKLYHNYIYIRTDVHIDMVVHMYTHKFIHARVAVKDECRCWARDFSGCGVGWYRAGGALSQVLRVDLLRHYRYCVLRLVVPMSMKQPFISIFVTISVIHVSFLCWTFSQDKQQGCATAIRHGYWWSREDFHCARCADGWRDGKSLSGYSSPCEISLGPPRVRQCMLWRAMRIVPQRLLCSSRYLIWEITTPIVLYGWWLAWKMLTSGDTQAVFFNATHLLCVWHLNKNVLQHMHRVKLGEHHETAVGLITQLYRKVWVKLQL